MSPKLAAAFRRRKPTLDYDQALTFGEWRLCEAICVLEGLTRKEHTVDVKCTYSYSDGKYTGDVVLEVNKQWIDGEMENYLRTQVYVHVATTINNDHCILMSDGSLKVDVLSIKDNNVKQGVSDGTCKLL